VTIAQDSAACFDLLSHVVVDGGALCAFVLFWGLLCGGVRFGLLCIFAASYMT
jgi:hypothetical protein